MYASSVKDCFTEIKEMKTVFIFFFVWCLLQKLCLRICKFISIRLIVLNDFIKEEGS